MIKVFGRDSYRPHAVTMALYWDRRPLAERLDGESYWRGEFVLTIEPPRRVVLPRVPNPYRISARSWTGRPLEFMFLPGYFSLKVRLPAGLDKHWRFGR